MVPHDTHDSPASTVHRALYEQALEQLAEVERERDGNKQLWEAEKELSKERMRALSHARGEGAATRADLVLALARIVELEAALPVPDEQGVLFGSNTWISWDTLARESYYHNPIAQGILAWMLLVRQGEVLTPARADERARNIVTALSAIKVRP